jgi:flavin-dependent dehydrogenase
VGVVAERPYLFDETRDLETIFQREVAKNPWVAEHLAAGRQTGEYFVTGEFSYRSKYCAADGLVLTGDAFGFLDPVFSSGVFLALRGGELAADAVDAALAAGDVSAARFAPYGAKLCDGIEAMRKLVYAFYNQNFSFRDFLAEFPHLRGDLTDCLIGHLFKDFDPLFDAMKKFADVPAPAPHGGPLLREAAVR